MNAWPDRLTDSMQHYMIWYSSLFSSRYLYRRNKKGITAKLDDDLLKFYCNEDTFLMQVTAIELEGMEGQDSIMYDITLCEIWEQIIFLIILCCAVGDLRDYYYYRNNILLYIFF